MGSVSSTKAGESFVADDWIPDDVLIEVFLRVPARDLLKSCILVSKRWHSLVGSQILWKMKCARDLGYCASLIHLLLNENFTHIYLNNPYKSNLIRNPDASLNYQHWKILKRGGDRFLLEKQPCGCDPIETYIDDHLKKPGEKIGCWTTSFGVCSKEQIIDLKARGVSKQVMDTLQPDINVSEWYAARFDCGSKYKVQVQLLAHNKSEPSKVLDEWTFDDELDPGRSWFKAEHTFKKYGKGVRFIRFYHQGVDSNFWKGWYGVKMTMSAVTFDLTGT